MRKALVAFPYFGGKTIHLDWLLPLLPYTQTYVEPFGGSGAVLLNRRPSPVEVYNDLDDEVVNYFRCVREDRWRLAELLRCTPYARAEFREALECKATEPFERARQFLVRIRGARSGLLEQKEYEWAFAVGHSSNGMSGKVAGWKASIAAVEAVAERLALVQIEQRPALKVLQQYDSEDTLFYCDPPYLPSIRRGGEYPCDMTEIDHKKVLELVVKLRGKVAISGYNSKLYERRLVGWYKHQVEVASSVSAAGSVRLARTECLWTNYKPRRTLF